MEEDEQEVLEFISHVPEDFLGIEDDKKCINIEDQALKDCITLEIIKEDNSKDNFAEAIISEILNELVGSIQERALNPSERATTEMLSEPANQTKPASEVTPQQSIAETVAEDISYFENPKLANTIVEDGKAEPEPNEISFLAKYGQFNTETEDNNLKDGTQTGDEEEVVWNL
jgi:hypothetical protein